MSKSIYSKIKAQLAQAIESDLKFIRDTTNDFNDRWDVFCEIHQQLPRDSCYFDLKKGIDDQELCYYDDLYADRYTVLDYPEIIEKLTEDDEWTNRKISEDQEKDMKERMMQSGCGSCKNDW